MSEKSLKTRIKQAYKKESEWSSSNPVLLAGEVAWSSDKNKYKIGNGTAKWSALSYIIPTKSDIGLGNVDNTADSAKSVKYATSAGNASSAEKLNMSDGSANNPIYFKNGQPVACAYSINKNVPSDAKFTDTTYGAAGTSLGLVKSGGDVSISNGIITVNDDSHNHAISNVDNLQSTIDSINNNLNNTNTQIGDIYYFAFYNPDSEILQTIKDNWGKLKNGFNVVRVSYKTTAMAFIQKHDEKYGSLAIFGYYTDPCFVTLTNGIWNVPKEYLTLNADRALTGSLRTKDIYPTGQNYFGSASAVWIAAYLQNLLLYKNGKETRIEPANIGENIVLTTPYESGILANSQTKTYIMSCYNFMEKYGVDSIPCRYGFVTIHGYSRPNTFNGDTYYMLIGSENHLWSGIQLNGATSITWHKHIGSTNFSLLGTTLTITT